MKRLKHIHFYTVALAVAAMLLPYGAVLRFVNPTDAGYQQEVLKTYSYFDPIVFGYANFAPLFCAIASVLLALLLLYTLFANDNKVLNVSMTVLSGAAFVLSVLPLVLYGLKFFNMTALLISFLLACSLIISLHRLTGKVFSPEEEEDDEE